MRFLADENFPYSAVHTLRAEGHDVAWVRVDGPGSPDVAVLERAVQESRVLLTFDKDFGELAWRHGLRFDCGIVLFRIALTPSPHAGAEIARLLSARDDWTGRFAVVEEGRIRLRSLRRS